MNKGITPLSELPLRNDFMFGQVMRNTDICKLFLEALLDVEIARIEFSELQKDVSDSYMNHGVRLDVYLKDNNGTVYDVEMQTARDSLEKRARFYQSAIDRNELDKGSLYDKLSESFVIFICDYDHYGDGLAVYEKESRLKTTNRLYEDGSHVIILNSRYEKGNACPAILEYLDFVRTDDVSRPYGSTLVKKTLHKVQLVRNDKELEVPYMTWQMKLQDERQKGREEGREEGRQEGQAELIARMLKKHSIIDVSELTGLPKEEIEQIAKKVPLA